MEITWEWYELRALIAALLVGLSCGILGCFIILKNMALIGDALSHAILPGVVVGFMVAGQNVVAFFTGSVIAGLLAAVTITWLQRKVKTKNDAAIGIVFSAMFAIGVIGLSHLTRQEGIHLDMKDFLFGNILSVTINDLLLTAVICFFVVACVLTLFRYFFVASFQPEIAQVFGISTSIIHYFLMLLLAFTVVAALQSVGVILVVSMLIIPASTALLLTQRLAQMVVWSAVIGILSCTLGLAVAIALDTTPGPAMTVVATIFYFLAILWNPKNGIIWQKINKARSAKAK